MTWSVQSTLSSSTTADLVREVLDNYVSGLSNFSVATPATSSSDRNVRIDISAKNIYTAQYTYYMFRGSVVRINGVHNSNGSATWQNCVITSTAGMSLPNPTGASKLWVSSESPGTFMIVDSSGKVIWGYIDFDVYATQGDGLFNTGTNTSSLTGSLLGFCSATRANYSGYPVNNTNNISSPPFVLVDFDSTFAGSYPQPSAAGRIIRGLRFQACNGTSFTSGDRTSIVGIVNNSDVLMHTGSGTSLGWIDSNSLQKVTDGTNWYLRTSSDLAAGALLLPVGTSEPTF